MHQNICNLINRLVGDVLLCTGFLSYLGPFNQDFRTHLNKKWMKEMRERDIPFTESLNVVDMLVDPTTVSTYRVSSLICSIRHKTMLLALFSKFIHSFISWLVPVDNCMLVQCYWSLSGRTVHMLWVSMLKVILNGGEQVLHGITSPLLYFCSPFLPLSTLA